jgi:hypothetical protein
VPRPCMAASGLVLLGSNHPVSTRTDTFVRSFDRVSSCPSRRRPQCTHSSFGNKQLGSPHSCSRGQPLSNYRLHWVRARDSWAWRAAWVEALRPCSLPRKEMATGRIRPGLYLPRLRPRCHLHGTQPHSPRQKKLLLPHSSCCVHRRRTTRSLQKIGCTRTSESLPSA